MDDTITETGFLLAAGFTGFETALFVVHPSHAAASGVPPIRTAD